MSENFKFSFIILLGVKFTSQINQLPVIILNMAVNPYFRVVGAWTKAGVASCIRIDGQSKEDNVLLDCGICHSESYSVKVISFFTFPHLFISFFPT